MGLVMRPKERRQTGQSDLFRARLDHIVDLHHPVVKLARAIEWRFLEEQFGAGYTDEPGPPAAADAVDGRVGGPQAHARPFGRSVTRALGREPVLPALFRGEEFFCHKLPFDRSSLTRWRQRMGEDQLVALIQESLANPDPHGSR